MRNRVALIVACTLGAAAAVWLLRGTPLAQVVASMIRQRNNHVSGSLNPQITKIEPELIFCNDACVAGNLRVLGSGFAPDQTVEVSHGALLNARFVNSSQIVLTLSFDSMDFWSDWVKITVSTPSGFRCSANAAFDNGKNMATQSVGNRFYSLDQEDEMVRAFDTSFVAGNFKKATTLKPVHSCFVGSSLAREIAVDDLTGLLVVLKSNFIVIMRPDDCEITRVFAPPMEPKIMSSSVPTEKPAARSTALSTPR